MTIMNRILTIILCFTVFPLIANASLTIERGGHYLTVSYTDAEEHEKQAVLNGQDILYIETANIKNDEDETLYNVNIYLRYHFKKERHVGTDGKITASLKPAKITISGISKDERDKALKALLSILPEGTLPKGVITGH